MSSNNMYNITKPLVKEKNWMIFPNATLSQINTKDCNNTIEGECYNDKTFDQCIQSCKDSPECNFGYYISNIQGSNNICVPLRELNIDSNPVYRLRTQNIYSEMDGTDSKVFIDKTIYPFPPEQANIVFFMDNFLIQNTETKKFLETSPISHEEFDQMSTPVSFEENGDLIVQALQIPPDLSAGTQYVSIKYGNPIAFNIPNTTLVMRPNPSDNTMEWISRSYVLSEHDAFYLKPLTPGREMGDEVRYSDIFSIHSNVSIITIDKGSSIERLYYESHSKAKDKGANATFRFIPKMKGWYCDKDAQCKEIPLEKMVINDKGIGTYNGVAIVRNPGCWGVCKYKVKNQPHLKPLEEYKEDDGKRSFNAWYIIIPAILILVVVVVVIYLRKH